MLLEEKKGEPMENDEWSSGWEMFSLITSTWYGKQCYFIQMNGSVYSRVSGSYMDKDEALKEFLNKIGDDGSV